MKRTILVLLTAFLLIGSQVYAGNGDLIVNGKTLVGTSTFIDTTSSLQVQGAARADSFNAGGYATTCVKTYSINTATPQPLVDCAGNQLALNRQYLIEGWIAGTAARTGARATISSDGTTFDLHKEFEAGTTFQQIEFFLNANVPSIRLYNHATLYTAHVKLTELTNVAGNNRGYPFGIGAVYSNGSSNVGMGTTSPTQKLEVNGGVRLNTDVIEPSCNSNSRGTIWLKKGGAGVADSLDICIKNASENYIWVKLN